MAFDEVQFPTNQLWGTTGGPSFSTIVLVSTDGWEFRNRNWAQVRRSWDISKAVQNQTELDALLAFYHARNGPERGFRYKDWMDFKHNMLSSAVPVSMLPATGDASNDTFQLVKTYGDSENSYIRPITKPVDGTILVYVNSVLQTETIDYTIDYTTGIVTFVTPPPNTEAVEWEGEFDVPVRFMADSMPAQIDSFRTYSFPNLGIIEVRDPAQYVTQPVPSRSDIHHVRLDANVAFGASGGPAFKTKIFATSGGHEGRVAGWDQTRAQYDVAEALKDVEDFFSITDFFMARWGRAFAFRFRDWADYQLDSVDTNILETPDDTENEFTLVKRYTSGSVTFSREIKCPVTPGDEILSAKYGCLTVAADFTITIAGFDINHNVNIRFFDVDGREDRSPDDDSLTQRCHGQLNFALTPVTGSGNTADTLNITDVSPAGRVTVTENLVQANGSGFVEGLLTGETVYITGVGGITNINNTRFKITRFSATQFDLDGFTPTGTYTTGGVATKTPQTGEVLRVDGDFDVPVRFDTDAQAFTHEQHSFHSWGQVPLVEVRIK